MINDIKYLIIADLRGDYTPVWVHKMRYYDLHSFSGEDGKEAEEEMM